MRTIRRRFPDYGWAWPAGGLDTLLKAALRPDEEEALRDGMSWLATHDIDVATFREHRLLAAIAERFGKKLSASPVLPRLKGLQRMLWTRSRMALRDSRESLDALARAGLPFMLIKGASHVADNPSLGRSRVSHDIDILVRPQDMRRAFEILMDHGWNAASGAGHLRLKERAAAFRAMNFFKGEFGDIDLHQAAYHPSQTSAEDEDALWERSLAAKLDGIPVRIPAASDRIALAIAHSSFDAHAHSDWLVDIARTIAENIVDWGALFSTLEKRHVLVPAASAFTYLAIEIGRAFPADALDRIVEQADKRGMTERLLLLECKPKTDLGLAGAAARGIVKQLRLRKAQRNDPATRETIWRTRIAKYAGDTGLPKSEKFALPVERPGASVLELIMQVDMPPVRRRIEFELSTEKRHLAVLRHRKLGTGTGLRELSFTGLVELRDDERQLFIRSSASRAARYIGSEREFEQYRALPFAVRSAVIRPTKG